MKKLLCALTLAALSNLAGATTINNMIGSYKITNQDFPVLTIVTINANGSIKLTEQSSYGTLECTGFAKINSDVLVSQVKCVDGQIFTQRINLKGVTSFTKFTAPVYSSLYGQEVEMNFEKI